MPRSCSAAEAKKLRKIPAKLDEETSSLKMGSLEPKPCNLITHSQNHLCSRQADQYSQIHCDNRNTKTYAYSNVCTFNLKLLYRLDSIIVLVVETNILTVNLLLELKFTSNKQHCTTTFLLLTIQFCLLGPVNRSRDLGYPSSCTQGNGTCKGCLLDRYEHNLPVDWLRVETLDTRKNRFRYPFRLKRCPYRLKNEGYGDYHNK